jgi:GTP 3',8-cyclase
MPQKIIPIVDWRRALITPQTALMGAPQTINHTTNHTTLRDALGRPLRDLRVSVTDRCNFRCSYCMPKHVFDKNYRFLPQTALLSFEEITRMARIFVALGVQKIRLTGGEPLLRKNLNRLIASLSLLRTPQGKALDMTLTTNGSALAHQAQTLKNAGLQRVTISLDALDDAVFRRMNDADFPVADVLAGIEAAQRAGLTPIKINMVVKRGVNDDQILPMARRFQGTGVVLRFIEYMDVGSTNGWRMDEVLPSAQAISRIHAELPFELPLVPVAASAAGETAARWRYADGSGEIGVISSVTQAFCHDCNRARLSTEGKLFSCLFATQGHDLRSLLRSGCSDDQLTTTIAQLWQQREDRYSSLRHANSTHTNSSQVVEKRVEMHYIGG